MGTDMRILKLAFENLMNEFEVIKEQNFKMGQELSLLKEKVASEPIPLIEHTVAEDVLLDTKEVLRILGVCYNTLQKVVVKGLLKPIRINQRRVRYSKVGVLEYIKMKQLA